MQVATARHQHGVHEEHGVREVAEQKEQACLLLVLGQSFTRGRSSSSCCPRRLLVLPEPLLGGVAFDLLEVDAILIRWNGVIVHQIVVNSLWPRQLSCLLWPCSSPIGLVGLIGSDLESGGQVHGDGCEGFSEVINQCPEEGAKCLLFTRLRIRGSY